MSTFEAVKVIYFAEVLACSLSSDLCRNEVSELVKIIIKDEGWNFASVGDVPITEKSV